VELLKQPRSPENRPLIAEMGRLGGDPVVEIVCMLSRDADLPTKRAAVEILVSISSPRAAQALVGMLESVRLEDEVRAGLIALGEGAVEPLIGALRSGSRWTRRQAAEVLARIGGRRAVTALIAALDDEPMRGTAAKALGQLGDLRAVEPLIRLLKDANPGVRVGVAESLGQLGDDRAVEPLFRALSDGPTANSAARALAARVPVPRPELARPGHGRGGSGRRAAADRRDPCC
jgi:HEAT repeat protein